MEKEKFTKEQILSYLESKDKEICEAAFGYMLRNIVKNNIPMFQMSDVLQHKSKIPDRSRTEIITNIGKQLNEEQEINHFIKMSYWFYEQPLYICKVLNENHNAYFEKCGLEILTKLAPLSYIPDECYQYLTTRALAENETCLNTLLEILRYRPNAELNCFLDMAKQRNRPQTISILTTIIQKNHNDKNLLPILQYISNCYQNKSYADDMLENLFDTAIKQYNGASKISYEAFNLIIYLCDKLKMKKEDLMQLTIRIIGNVSNDNPQIREKKVTLLKKVASLTNDYDFVLRVLCANIKDKSFKRIILLSVYAFWEQVEAQETLYSKYKGFILKFIEVQGANFDKSDFEYIQSILNQCKEDEGYYRKLICKLANCCRETSRQIENLLYYADINKKYSINFLQFIDWEFCPLEQAVLYRLINNYNNSEHVREKQIYMQILEQLSECEDLETDINILLGNILSKQKFSPEQLTQYPNIAKKIDEYKERQKILEALNN